MYCFLNCACISSSEQTLIQKQTPLSRFFLCNTDNASVSFLLIYHFYFQMKTYQNDQINKQTDQMYNLLAMCLVLHPQRIDESLHSMLKEKSYAEKMNKMQAGDHAEFEACFTFACPKFLSPVPPPIEGSEKDAAGMVHKEPLKLQLKVCILYSMEKQSSQFPSAMGWRKKNDQHEVEKKIVFSDNRTT